MAHPTILALGILMLSATLVSSVPTPQALTFRQATLHGEKYGRLYLVAQYALSAHQSSGARNCGPGRLIATGWTIQTEQWWARQSPNSPGTALAFNTLGGYFLTSTGTFQAPDSGVYLLSMSVRCETSACDVTMRLNFATQLCGMGTDILERVGGDDTGNFGGRWQSTSCATIEYLNAFASINMWMESGEGNDCTFETTFSYNHLNVLLLIPDTRTANFAAGPFG